MYFQVGKMYEWKPSNITTFTLYSGLQSNIYKENNIEIKCGSAVFVLEKVDRKESCDIRVLTDIGVIAWGRIFYRHVESTWGEL
jgi:hypothetical protein